VVDVGLVRVLARTSSARRTAVILWLVALACGTVGMSLQGLRFQAIVGTIVTAMLCLIFVAYRRVRARNLELAQHGQGDDE